jgi:hypothetical protein
MMGGSKSNDNIKEIEFSIFIFVLMPLTIESEYVFTFYSQILHKHNNYRFAGSGVHTPVNIFCHKEN